ncbi:MAG: Sjogren's syndrome/scleroderma autoantigen 1 family protein [Candidatus Helarchaeota archaeon]
MTSKNKQHNEKKNENIQKMAFLLREGHTLLSNACPQCNSPLFKMKSGEIYCASCDRKVLIVKDDEQIDIILQNKILDETMKILSVKIKELNRQIDTEKDFDELYKMTRLLLIFLDSLKKLKELKSKLQ